MAMIFNGLIIRLLSGGKLSKIAAYSLQEH